MQSKAKTVDEYLAEAPAERREALAALRKLIRKASPRAEETMLYGMPAYTLSGEMLCGFASQKNHLALYCCETEVVEEHRAELGKLDCGKGCIRFRKLEELPLDVITAILRETAARRKGKA